MSKPIRRACVIGAGVMGSGIAAHLANAGVQVLLLDIVPPGLSDEEKKVRKNRNRFADSGLANALKAKPAAFMHKSLAGLVQTGNVEDDLERLADVDLVIEAVVERLDIKRALFEKLEKVIGEDTIVASNTSGLRIKDMVEGRSESFKKRFLVMHFFNPVRYMKLLELVAGPDTDPAVVARIKKAGEDQLGKGIVLGKDTPNFVGNRIGVHSMLLIMQLMLEEGLTPEDVDAITGPPMGHPKSASFRTADMVGLDTFLHVADNCYESLVQDPAREVFKAPDFLRKMVEQKLLGNKTRAGFYKKDKAGVLTFDPVKLEYREKAGSEDIKKLCKKLSAEEDVRARVKALVADEGPAGRFAWKALSQSLAYSAAMIGEITDSVEAIDDAMRWGYNWELGPFETWDAIGLVEAAERMKKDGIALPASVENMIAKGAKSFYTDDGRVFDLLAGEYVARDRDPRAVPLALLRKGEKPVFNNAGASAWDLGDGILGLSFKTKANSIDADVVKAINETLDIAERDFQGVVIANEGDHFCVGANLFMIVMAAQQKAWDQIGKVVSDFQGAVQRIRYSTVPVVAAPFGMTVGGGLEICLAADATQAYAETYSGLVEVGVGLIPGGAGNVNMLFNALELIPEGAKVDTQAIVATVFENIAMAKVATSAIEAQKYGYFRHRDGVSFDRARHVYEAKQRALGLAGAGYHPPAPRAFVLPGESGIATIGMMIDTLVAGGFASEHDALIARKLAKVLCGGAGGHTHAVTEQEMLELEREVFISLCGEPKSQERMQHMLMKNKPLRN
ncbi:MAG: 3-hydroxyacyl-CoA dehydrogenase/enoyl-CoA hydratase family protein [Myxococcales bacterium]|nr:3-hydroxyacyl-CoA dehydrogenase/enoyl-CoA hydratase family protein [Myxococcales bacterium]